VIARELFLIADLVKFQSRQYSLDERRENDDLDSIELGDVFLRAFLA